MIMEDYTETQAMNSSIRKLMESFNNYKHVLHKMFNVSVDVPTNFKIYKYITTVHKTISFHFNK